MSDSTPLIVWMDRGAFVLPLLLLSPVGLAHYHLYQRLQPDPAARALQALWRTFKAVLLALTVWIVLQTALSVLLDLQSRLLPMLLASLLALMVHRQMSKMPRNWRQMSPYLSEDRAYHTFLRLVAERAAHAKKVPDRAPRYLARLYEDDRARLLAVSQYLEEQKGDSWLPLTLAQQADHPGFYRFPVTTLYVAALLPLILPFLLSIYDPVITEANLPLTAFASVLASLFYSPLFDAQILPWITALALGFVIVLAVTSEVARLRFLGPGLAGLIALALCLSFVTSDLQTYVIERADTPLMMATDYVLGHLAKAAALVEQVEVYRGMLEVFVSRDALAAIEDADTLIEMIRQRVLTVQSRLGGLFILPALVFWTTLTLRVIWELNYSAAAQVTFRARMRKPQI